MNLLTPDGVDDFLPEATARFDDMCAKLATVFFQSGYRKIQTPTLEFYDTLALGMGENFDKIAVRFFDPVGQVMVLRPDHTVPIARMVATHMPSDFPLKLSYFNPIFRSQLLAGESEQFQAGVECIGAGGVDTDADMIALCIDSLKAVGFENVLVDIGHVDFVSAYSDRDREALISGDYVALGEIPQRGPLESLSGYSDLQAVYQNLSSRGYGPHVFFNKGLVKALDYYTGIIFECVIPGCSSPVASGGRYDRLMSKYGVDQSAVGFALNLSLISTFKEDVK